MPVMTKHFMSKVQLILVCLTGFTGEILNLYTEADRGTLDDQPTTHTVSRGVGFVPACTSDSVL